MRTAYLPSLLVLTLLSLTGCGDSGKPAAPATPTSPAAGGTTPAPASNKLTIAVIPKGTTHEFWKSIHAGAEMAKAELPDVDIIWKGPAKEDERESQIAVVETFISQKVSGIVLAPLDDVALQQPVAAAKKAGIPVIIIDSGLKGDDYASFVATDNYVGGKMAGEQLAKLMGGTGKAIMLRYQEGSASTRQREQGFMDGFGVSKGIEVLSSNQYAGPTAATAQVASENLLTTSKDADGKLTIQGIFCPNESSTAGMLLALGKNAGSVKFVGFDASPTLVTALTEGKIDALIVQNPMKMGYEGVKQMAALLHGGKIEKKIDTGVKLVTKENMGTPEMQELLHPPLDKWLK